MQISMHYYKFDTRCLLSDKVASDVQIDNVKREYWQFAILGVIFEGFVNCHYACKFIQETADIGDIILGPHGGTFSCH